MNEVLAAVLQSIDRDVGETIYLRLERYIKLLASTSKTDERLHSLGKAYLHEILNPDPRYSGC